MTNTEVIASVAGDLTATELAVDEAIARATTLVQSMIGARTALGVSPVAGAAAQAKALETIACLASARQAAMVCHEELAKDHRRFGYGTYMSPMPKSGDGDRPPVTEGRRLRAV